MPRDAFPLSKARSYALGSGWRWCVCELECLPNRYRLLVAFDQGKEQYQAWLGLQVGGDQALIGRLEYHPSHRGWHCHLKTGDLSDAARGVVKEPGRREKCKVCDENAPFGISEANGLAVAFRVFGVESPHEDGGLFS